MAAVLGLMLFCAFVITLSIYRKWKIELEIEGLLWKIDPSDLLGFYNKDIVSSPSKVLLNRSTRPVPNKSGVRSPKRRRNVLAAALLPFVCDAYTTFALNGVHGGTHWPGV